MSKSLELFILCLLSTLIHAAIGGWLLHWATPSRQEAEKQRDYEISVLKKAPQKHAFSIKNQEPSLITNSQTVAPPGGSPHSGNHPTLSTQSTSTPGAKELYASRVRARIENSLRYPISLRRRGLVGQVTLQLVIDARGVSEAPQLKTTSGSSELDELALEAARNAAPYPAPGTALEQDAKFVLELPIEFKIGVP